MKSILCILFVCVLSTLAFAQTVTVDAANASPNNTSTFNSLQMAIKSFQASGGAVASTDGAGVGVNHGNVAADIINVVAGTTLDEWVVADAQSGGTGSDQVVLDSDLTIQGSGGQAVIALQMNSAAASGATVFSDCGFCWRQDVNLTLKDLALIPSLTNKPTDDGVFFRSTTNQVNTTVTIDNVVVTANNGSGAPVTLTGLDSPDTTGATSFGDDGLLVVSRTEGGSIAVNATHLVVALFNPSSSSGRDGVMVFMNGTTSDIVNATLNLGAGCVISNCLRFGIQNPYGGYVNIQGTDAEPVILAKCGGDAIWNSSDVEGTTQATIAEVNHCIISECGGGIKEQETGGRGFIKSVKNTIIAHCKAPGIEFYAKGALPPTGGVTSSVSIENVTVLDCGYDMAAPGANYDFRAAGIASPTYTASSVVYQSNRNVDILNTIVSGPSTGLITGLYNSSTGAYTIDYSALPTGGIWNEGLAAATGGAATITVGANVLSASPIYVASAAADFASADFADVRNPAYGGAAQAGTDLAGGADYIGDYTPPLSASTWEMYQ